MWTCQNVYTLCIFLFAEARYLVLKLQISDGQVVPLPWKQKYKYLEFYLFMTFVDQTWVIYALYISFIYIFAEKRYLDLTMVNF